MRLKKVYFDYLRYTKSATWAKYLFRKGVPISDFNYSKKDNSLYIRSVDHTFSAGEFPVFFEGYRNYCWKFLNNGFQFLFEQGGMFVRIKDLTIKVETVEELYIINEVFVENMYKVESKSDYVVFDIGMNVGITSLYLSQYDNITKIYGFEPFKPTYQCASVNARLNAPYASKITMQNFGLSNENKWIELPYDPDKKGNVGLKNVGVAEFELNKVEQIELRKAPDCLREMIAQHHGSKFVVKMDCEGSEYDILESLDAAAMLSSFDIFMIEWHKMDGYLDRLQSAIRSLRDNNFLVLTPGSLGNEIGMIYAIKNKGEEG